VFEVEQGTLFYLSYGANTYTTLSANNVELYRDGEHLQRVQGGTITLEGSYMRIQAVNRRHEGDYTIRTSSGEQVSFQLKVKGTNDMGNINEILYNYLYSYTCLLSTTGSRLGKSLVIRTSHGCSSLALIFKLHFKLTIILVFCAKCI
jgi:hypothetical protein